VDELFAEYADAFARGDRPSSADYLARAGEGANELASLLDRFVAGAPAPRPTEAETAWMDAWLRGEPPLLELRVRRGLKRDQVVDALVGALGVPHALREKVARYYHELESGLLDAARVDRRVWDALANVMRSPLTQTAAWRPGMRQQAVAAFYRADETAAPAPAAPAAQPAPPEPDEVDRLFTGGRS
jgi:hypothetical protein